MPNNNNKRPNTNHLLILGLFCALVSLWSSIEMNFNSRYWIRIDECWGVRSDSFNKQLGQPWLGWNRNILEISDQYYDCWCFGSLRHLDAVMTMLKDIIFHYRGLQLPVTYECKKDGQKCKHILMFPKKADNKHTGCSLWQMLGPQSTKKHLFWHVGMHKIYRNHMRNYAPK